jgi:Protein kinase domain
MSFEFQVLMRLENGSEIFPVRVWSHMKVVEVLEDLQTSNATLARHKLTLFIFIDGIERFLPRDFVFEDLHRYCTSQMNPLVIKTSALRVFDQRRCLLPTPIYGKLPAANITSASDFFPDVLPWGSFKSEVNGWIGSDADTQKHNTISQPSIIRFQITSEIPSLQSFYILNALKTANQALPSRVQFDDLRNAVGVLLGDPDYMLLFAGGIVGAPIELKGKWSISDEDLIKSIKEGDSFVIHAVAQIFTYMNACQRKYGILSTVEKTWFLRRIQNEGQEHLEISEAVSYNQANPTLIEALVFFGESVTGDQLSKYRRQISATNSAINSATSSAPNSRPGSSGSSETKGTQALSETTKSILSKHAYGDLFFLDDFSLTEQLGESHAKVFKEYFNDSAIALKVHDVRRDKQKLAELQNEIQVYQKLEDLQGRYIPELVLYGELACVFYCLGISVVGSVPRHLSKSQKDHLIEGLNKMHQRNIIHGDIKAENIIIDDKGSAFWIDFSHSRQIGTDEEKEEEMKIFLNMIANL